MRAERAFELKIREAIIYPLAIAAATLGISAAVLMAVGPKLAGIFAALAIEPPLTTKIIIASGIFLIQSWYVIILAVFFLALFLKTKKGKKMWDHLTLKLPVISPITKKINIINTVECLGPLIAAGVPSAEALQTSLKSVKNHYYREAITGMVEKMKGGDKLSSALRGYFGLYPLTVSQAIEVGEETEKMPVILEKLSGFFEEDVLGDIKNLRRIGDPLLMLIIGGIIGFLAVSIIQPLILF